MADEKTNGHDPMTVRMVELLERIATRLDSMQAETNARLDALKTITENAFRHVHERIDETHEETVRNTERRTAVPDGLEARLRDHEERLAKLEARRAT
jgi:hypothetical protein